MDLEIAEWIAGLIRDAVPHLEQRPGLLIESEDDSAKWVQVVLESTEDHEQAVGGIVLNFSYKEFSSPPLETLREAGLRLPPGTSLQTWEPNGFATIWIRPDVPLLALAMLIGDILHRICGTDENPEVSVEVNYGF